MLLSTDDTLTMRLNGDPAKNATVEIYDEFGTWGPICPIKWNLQAAEIVCRHLGYESTIRALQVEAKTVRPKMLQVECQNSGYVSFLQCNTETNILCIAHVQQLRSSSCLCKG